MFALFFAVAFLYIVIVHICLPPRIYCFSKQKINSNGRTVIYGYYGF